MNGGLHANFRLADWAWLAAYLVFLLVIGFWPRRRDADSYLIGSRRLSLPVFVATLVATWYGGILGAGEFVYGDGISAWVAQGLPYYVFGVLFALLLAARVNRAGGTLYTIPDKLAAEYDTKTAVLGALLAFLYAVPGTYILMVGTLLQAIFGWPLPTSLIVGAMFSVVYVFRGGFLSDVRVNTLQFVLMFAGFTIAVWICLTRYGLSALHRPGALPPTHLTLFGTHSPVWALVWFFIALTTLTDPGFHQRCYAASRPRVAVSGILIAVLFWMAFDLLTTTTGLFARALVPDLTNATMAFPALAEKILPTGWKGLFYLGMLAPIMASAISYTFIAAVTIGRDLIWRIQGERAIGNVPAYTRIGIVVTALLSILIALKVPSVVKQWYYFGSVFVPGMLVPLLGAYAPNRRWKARAGFAFGSMLTGAGVALGWLIWGWSHGGVDDPHFPFDWQPMYPGLLISAVYYGVGLLVRPGTNSGAAPL